MRAGPSIAERSSGSSIGPSRAVDASSAAPSPGTDAPKPKKSARIAITTSTGPPGAVAASQQGVDEPAALGGVGAERERLLELVDEHDEPVDARVTDGGGEPRGSCSSRACSAPGPCPSGAAHDAVSSISGCGPG